MKVMVAFTWRGGIEVNAKSLEEAISRVSDMALFQRTKLLNKSQFECVDVFESDGKGNPVENQPAHSEVRD